MFFNSSRKILCFLLTTVIVIGISMFTGATLLVGTLCSQGYVNAFFGTDTVKEYSNQVYNERIELLAENSGIPTRVFDASENVAGYSETFVHRFFSGSDTSIFTNNKIETYEKLIKEYLDGNGIKYEDELVHNTAVRAAEIYADSYGVRNVGIFKNFVNNSYVAYNHISSAGMMIALVGILLIFVMFSKKKETYRYYASAATASGLTFIWVGVLSLVFRIGKGAVITPAVYQRAMFNSISMMFIILVLIGISVTAVSTIISLRLHKLTKNTRNK